MNTPENQSQHKPSAQKTIKTPREPAPAPQQSIETVQPKAQAASGAETPDVNVKAPDYCMLTASDPDAKQDGLIRAANERRARKEDKPVH